jgi:biopolymer transport protein TolR
VVVDKAGQAFLDDQPLTQAALGRRLQPSWPAAPDTEVQLRADEGVPYGRVVEVMGGAEGRPVPHRLCGRGAEPLKA